MSEGRQTKITKLTYHCPICAATIDVSTTLVGSQVDCPNCSVPILVKAPEAEPSLEPQSSPAEFSVEKPTDDETTLLKAHPALFRKRPIRTLGLAVLGIGAFIFGISSSVNASWTMAIVSLVVLVAVAATFGYWYLEILWTTLTITNKRTILRQGIIEKRTSEVQHDDIRNLQVHQNMFERVFGIGDLAISSSGQDDLEVQAIAIPDPDEVAELVRRMQ